MKKEILTISIGFLLFTITFCGCLEETSVVETKFISVDDDGDADYTQIQNAIDAASDGDTIFVNEGTYYETLVIDKSISLIGEDKDKTIIRFQESSKISQNIILIYANSCTVKEFKLIGDNTSSDIVGIKFNSSNNTISNNIIMFTNYGIYIDDNSKNNNVSLNIISNCSESISSHNADNNNISRNSISSSSLYGIYLFGSDNNMIFGNNVSNNGHYGMRIKSSKNNMVYGNTVSNNKEGIYLCCGSVDNTVWYNIIQQNSVWNAKDVGVNHWDNGGIGNYWGYYSGIDADGDGVGDTPHNISGMHNQDKYPLMDLITLT